MYLAARPDRMSSVREIADHYSISYNHLVKVVHKLSQLGYVASAKGKGGGVRIARPPSEYRLGDLVKTLEPSMNIVECFDAKSNTCLIVRGCQLKHFLSEASQSFISTLNKYTVEDAIRDRLSLFQLAPLSPP